MKITQSVNKLGTIGLFITAILSPCCFPIFAFAASLLGLGTQEIFGGMTMWIFQVMVLISVVGLFISYRRHGCLYPLLIAIPGALLVLYGYHLSTSDNWIYFLYAGMFGLLAATIWDYQRNKMHRTCGISVGMDDRAVELKSTLTCPACGHKTTEVMPVDSCVYFCECDLCKTHLKPLPGDCCVYCSYGSVKCPPIQAGKGCC